MADARTQKKGPHARTERFHQAISQFGEELGPRIRGDGRNEDRLRAPVSNLIRRLGEMRGAILIIHDEVTMTALRSRPDIAVDAPSGRIGYIELKAPGKGTPETWRATKHDRDQWEKLKALPNLVYTDGISWALYNRGILVGEVGVLVGDLATAGSRLRPANDALEALFEEFLDWRPAVPHSLKSIVSDVAPLCRLLRDQVIETLYNERAQPKQPFTTLAMEWRSILFPGPRVDVDESAYEFADSYAQAVTFGLLLARVDGVLFEDRTPTGIAEQLAKQHSLLGEALAILADRKWVGHLNVVDILVRVIGNIDWTYVRAGDADTYARLYETFLECYDPALRRRSGTYYTPAPVARAMVSFVDEILKSRLNKTRGFASSDVFTLDPAMGAGTFLATVLEQATETIRIERGSDSIPEAHLRELFSERLIGFEIQAAPFAVAELRLHAAMRNRYQVDLPAEEARFLTDTLDDPYIMAFEFGQLYDVLKESRHRANQVKRDVPVMVVIGNPPWRERARGAAPWIERRRDPAKPASRSDRPSLDDFRLPGNSRRDFKLNNMWTYFWRWSTWRAFEANDPAGIVALITPSAYLTAASYAGMRQYLRQSADEGWIIDLSPEEHRPDVRTRIFPETQHPICIGIFVRSGQPRPELPAPVHYIALNGSQEQKFDALGKLSTLSTSWRACPTSWQSSFRPAESDWETYPALSELVPWQHTGVNSNRNWVWAPDSETLERRWSRLIHADPSEKSDLFKETDSRKIDRCYPMEFGTYKGARTPISLEFDGHPELIDVALRSFDRHLMIFDSRVVDRPRLELWQTRSSSQVYICEQHAHPISDGPGVIFTSLVPSVDCFDGRGGRVLPLYRDAAATVANLAPGLLATLARVYDAPVSAEDVLAYVACVCAHAGFTERFREALKSPGIRVPLTMEIGLWQEAIRLGRRVVWLHTFGERMVDGTCRRPLGLGPRRRSKYIDPVIAADDALPTSVRYEQETETLVIGDDTLFARAGRVHPVRKQVWEYSVGGVQIVRKWFSYRHPSPVRRKRTSPLDDINPRRWTSVFDDELLNLLEVLEGCVEVEFAQATILDQISAGRLISRDALNEAGVLPAPARYRKPPKVAQMDPLSES